MKTRDGYGASVGSRIRTVRAGEDYPPAATGTVEGLGLFTHAGFFLVHLDGMPVDQTVLIRRIDVMEIHGAHGDPE